MQVLLFTALAGICGMGLGGFVSVVILKRPSGRMICWLLMFAAGVMTSIVCFGLVPEAISLSGIVVSIIGLILGVVTIMILNRLVDRVTDARAGDQGVHLTHEELYHEGSVIRSRSMMKSGIIMLTAIALHNIPEGMAIGAGGSHDFQLGLMLAIMIAMHNIPEGMAVAAPLIAGGLGRGRVIFLTSLSGAPTLIGGVIGMLIGSISDMAVAMALSAAGGAMLYVVFGEMIPQSIIMTRSRAATIVALFGLIVGLIITQL